SAWPHAACQFARRFREQATGTLRAAGNGRSRPRGDLHTLQWYLHDAVDSAGRSAGCQAPGGAPMHATEGPRAAGRRATRAPALTMSELLTIGYEGCTISDVLAELRAARGGVLIDVRAVPQSCKPGFSKRQFAAGLD